MFMAWVGDSTKNESEDEKKIAAEVDQMLAHPWLGFFLEAVGADPGEWGKGTGDVALELAIWKEWLQHAEEQLVRTTLEKGAPSYGAADPAHAETQAMETWCSCSMCFANATYSSACRALLFAGHVPVQLDGRFGGRLSGCQTLI